MSDWLSPAFAATALPEIFLFFRSSTRSLTTSAQMASRCFSLRTHSVYPKETLTVHIIILIVASLCFCAVLVQIPTLGERSRSGAAVVLTFLNSNPVILQLSGLISRKVRSRSFPLLRAVERMSQSCCFLERLLSTLALIYLRDYNGRYSTWARCCANLRWWNHSVVGSKPTGSTSLKH